MFSDGVVDLCEKGAITNSEKTIMTGKIVSSFAVGTKRLYDFMHNNPFVGKYSVVKQENNDFGVLQRNLQNTLVFIYYIELNYLILNPDAYF